MNELNGQPRTGRDRQLDSSFDDNHGTHIEDISKPLIFYWNRKSAVSMLNRQTLFGLVFTLVFLSIFLRILMPPQLLNHNLFIPLMVAAVGVLAALGIAQSIAKRDFTTSMEPIVEIRPEGLTIRCPLRSFETIPWTEIREIRKTKFLWTFVGIFPVNLEDTLMHASEDKSKLARGVILNGSQCARLNLLTQQLFGRLGLNVAPIEIPAHWLPLDADELVEILNKRRNHALLSKVDDN